jgi:Cellulase (glycosyl hydrolase family 5)/Family of unknown function (DUF6298)
LELLPQLNSVTIVLSLSRPGKDMSMPIRIHAENSKIFEFRGKPLVLVTATEHYGAVMNRPFRFDRYLADAAEKGHTLTRLFMLFRELQTAINPYSTCKPESPDYVAPFVRTGPGHALDGELKYDLDAFNPEFFDRLHQFVSLASQYGIIVEIVLLSHTYNDAVWALNPLNPNNNISGLSPDFSWPDYLTLRDPGMVARQKAMIGKVVAELNPYDNVLYEICNEPGRLRYGNGAPTVEEINQWLSALIQHVRDIEARLPSKHLIAGQEAWSSEPWEQPSDLSFSTLDYDIVNIHPLPNTVYRGRGYELGPFMSKQLRLRELRDYGLATYAERKPLNQDEDNIASEYKDTEGWTIHRKRAWTTLLTGGHYDYIDFSIWPYLETGTPASQRHIRSWIGYLSAFVHSVDLIRARPLPGLLRAQPPFTLDVSFVVAGEDYCIYLADERELAAAKNLPANHAVPRGPGALIRGQIALDLPDGLYEVASFDPKTGLYSPSMPLNGGANVQITLPTFVHDIVIRIRRSRDYS